MGFHPIAATAMLAGTLVFAVVGLPQGVPSGVVVQSEFIYDHGPYPSVHASTLVETTSGQLVAAWFGGTEEGNADVAIWVARLEQGRWSSSVKVADGVQDATTRYPTWNPVLFQPTQG